jgi:hypothetical protein
MQKFVEPSRPIAVLVLGAMALMLGLPLLWLWNKIATHGWRTTLFDLVVDMGAKPEPG